MTLVQQCLLLRLLTKAQFGLAWFLFEFFGKKAWFGSAHPSLQKAWLSTELNLLNFENQLGLAQLAQRFKNRLILKKKMSPFPISWQYFKV